MAQALRTALVRIGLSNEAANYATGEMGLATLDEWRDLHTDSDLEGIVKNLRSPGGWTLPPGAEAGAPQVKHPGFPISVKAISNLHVMRVALKHFQHIQRTVTPATIDMEWIEQWEFLVDFNKANMSNRNDGEDDLPKVTMNDWAKTKEKIFNHFSEVYGKDGIPLAYIIRDESEVKPEAEDPQANYEEDHVKELIARAPHAGKTYRADNRMLCRLLKKMMEDTPADIYVSKYTANGRQAWLDLMEVYLGPQHVDLQATIYEGKIKSAHYSGESQRFNFAKYAEIYKTAHNRLHKLTKHGYSGIDEGTKIRHFLEGIKDEKLKTAVELVRANPEYRTFDKVHRRIWDTVVVVNKIDPKNPNSNSRGTRNVGAVRVTNSKGEEVFTDVEPDTNVDDKYYTPKEWSKLSNAKKKGVLYKRNKRKRGGGSKPDKDEKDKKEKSKVSKLTKKVNSLSRKVAAITVNDDDEAASSGSDTEPEEPPKKKSKKKEGSGNRSHPALNRR
jgi:hypothetical protein